MFFDYKKNQPWMENLSVIMQLGLTMAGCIVVCFFAGRYLDRLIGTKGIFVTALTLFGVVGGANVVYRQIIEIIGGRKRVQGMEPVRQIQKKYCSKAMMIAIIAAFISVLAGYKPVAKGLILGTLFSVLNFIIMGETLPSRIIPSERKAFFISLGSILFRYVLLAIPLFISLKYNKEMNFVAAVVGIFMLQLVVLAEYILNFIALRFGKI